jgi:uncharacterized protein (DUF2336 family)
MADTDKRGGSRGGNLTAADVERLMADPSGNNRAVAAGKIAQGVEAGALSPSERQLAEEIFRIMVRDVEVRVREALAVSLKDVPDLAGDIAVSLASDEADSVALQMLESSSAWSDEDLVAIVSSGHETRQVAVAKRETVSEVVSDALVETGNEDAVVALVGNEGAEISENTLQTVVDRYGDSERVQTPLVHRKSLPVTVSERLVAKVSDQLKEYLVAHHELSPAVAADLLLESRERALVGILAEGDHADVFELVDQMAESGRLTTSIILRALCTGDLTFFEAAVARKADVPVENARILIHDEGDLGFRSLYDKAKLPDRLYKAFRAAVDIAQVLEAERDDKDPEARARLIMERILTQFEDPLQGYDSDDVDYLLGRLVHVIENEDRPAA